MISGLDAYVPGVLQSSHLDLVNFGGSLNAGISSRIHLLDPAFAGNSILQLEFDVEIKWGIGSPQI